MKSKSFEWFFSYPTNKNEVSSIISSFNSKMLINISFSSEILPPVLKITKDTSVHKKVAKPDCSNYRPISILPRTEKILEKLWYNRVIKFSNDNTVIYHLQFGFSHYSMKNTLINLTEDKKEKPWWRCGIFN